MPHSQLFRLDGRRALVTGASRGIGRAIAVGLAEQGAHVLVHYHRNEAAAADVLREVAAGGGSGELLQADLVDPVGADRLADATVARGPIDVLVLNAAIQERRPLAEVDRGLDRHVNANLWSAIRLIQAALPGMRERRWGRVVAVGSIQQFRPNPNLLTYAGLKSALSTIMRSLAKAEARNGVTQSLS